MKVRFSGSMDILKDYVVLTKPRIVLMLLLTALVGMVFAARGIPDFEVVVMVLVSGALASGGAQAINHGLERDIDSQMIRTRRRPVASGRISSHAALMFGVVLNVMAFAILVTSVNVISAVLTLTATLIYVFVYTLGLKRSTPQNIVIGGAAGAIPPVVGWAAVTGGVGLPAVYLFAIIFFWTPPHFWALALLAKDDYARARIPMLPVVASVRQTKIHILLYSLILVTLTLMFFTTQTVGWFYLAGVSILNVALIYYSYRLLKLPGIRGARPAYLYSLLYLALLFTIIAIDGVSANYPQI